MELQYMQTLADNPNLMTGVILEGLDELEVLKLEGKYMKGGTFPLAFREYLLVGGIRSGTGAVWYDFDDLFEELEEVLEDSGDKIQRPFFVFDRLDSQFSGFFLDEETEDPDLYIFDPYGKKRGEFPLFRSANGFTFSGLINEAIRRKKLGLSD